MQSFFLKRVPHILQGRHYVIVPLRMIWRKKLKLVNILELAKVGIEWKEASGTRYQCSYYKPLCALHHVSLILFSQISEHSQYALLTKLLGQFTEVDKSQFFQRLENLIWDCIVLFFLQHLQKLGFNFIPLSIYI